MKNLLYIFLFFFSINLHAQQTPAKAQSTPIYIVGATAHLGNGQVVENSLIAFENGKLTVVASAADAPANAPNAQVIDAKGKHVYPGLIALNTQLGLVEIGAVRATRDNDEVGDFNPNIRSIIAYNTDSDVTPTVRSNGALLAQIVPQGGRMSGLSSVVELDGWNWEDAAYQIDDGVHVNWPRRYTYQGPWGNRELKKNEKYDEQVRELGDFLAAANAYRQKSLSRTEPVNLKLEALKPIFENERRLYIHVNEAKAMMEAVLMTEKMNIKPVLMGGEEAWLIVDFLKKRDIAIVLGQSQDLPQYPDSDIAENFKTAATLSKAGVRFALSGESSWQQRNLSFQAGQAVAFGLDYEKAIQALTQTPAEIVGIADRVGTLEVGKDATLILCEGDVLDMRSNKIFRAFISGKDIDLGNKQKALYEKYKLKYGQ